MLRRHIEKNKLTWPQVRLGIHSQVVADYGAKGVPAYFLVGPDGRIVSTEENWGKIKATVANVLDARGQDLE